MQNAAIYASAVRGINIYRKAIFFFSAICYYNCSDRLICCNEEERYALL